MAAPWDEIVLIQEAFDKLPAEREIVSGLIGASMATQAREAELQEYLMGASQHRDDKRIDDAADALFGPLRVYLVEGVLSGNTDSERRNAWEKITGLTAAYR